MSVLYLPLMISIWYWVEDISSGVTSSSSPGQSSLLLLLSRLFLKTTRDLIQVVNSQYNPSTVHYRSISLQWDLLDLTHNETDLKHFIISRAFVSRILVLPSEEHCQSSHWFYIYFIAANKSMEYKYKYDTKVHQERGVAIDDDTGVSWWSLDITNESQPWLETTFV